MSEQWLGEELTRRLLSRLSTRTVFPPNSLLRI